MHGSTHTGHTGFNQSDCAVSRADSVQVSLRANAQSRSHSLPCAFQHLHSPFRLLHMLKVLGSGEKKKHSEIITSLRSNECRWQTFASLGINKVCLTRHFNHVELK